MIKKLVNPKYESISSFIHDIINPDYFENQGELLFAGRNIVKRFHIEGLDVVVKRYGHMTFFNRLMYSTFRKSKAIRAYLHASQLSSLEISTPKEIAAIEIYTKGILQDSYFISAYSTYHSMAFLRDKGFDGESMYPLINAMVEWIVELHDKGIFHQDLNVSNILYKKLPNGKFVFQVIDNNRMKFSKKPSMDMRLKNLCRLSVDMELHNYILKQYAQKVQQDYKKTQIKGSLYKLILEYRQIGKQRIKEIFRKTNTFQFLTSTP